MIDRQLMETGREREREGETDRQTETERERQTDRQTEIDPQRNTGIDKETYEKKDIKIARY